MYIKNNQDLIKELYKNKGCVGRMMTLDSIGVIKLSGPEITVNNEITQKLQDLGLVIISTTKNCYYLSTKGQKLMEEIYKYQEGKKEIPR